MKQLFKPKVYYDYLYSLVERSPLRELTIENTTVHSLITELTDLAEPSFQDKYDRRWSDFYLPLRKKGRRITVPFSVQEYKKEYYLGISRFGQIKVTKGEKKVFKEYEQLFQDTLKYVSLMQEDPQLPYITTPYEYRRGKIQGKYVMERVMPQRTKKMVLNKYKRHQEKNLTVSKISLDDYLETAAIAYRAAYGKGAEELTPLEMYKCWADNRDGKMLSISDSKSKDEYTEWLESSAWTDCHPFEIVFSWHRHGIHLVPPREGREDENTYYLKVTNYNYAPMFIRILKALIDNEIPVQAGGLVHVLDYLAGDIFFSVNGYGYQNFDYYPSKEYKQKYFHHIEWDDLKILKWKS